MQRDRRDCLKEYAVIYKAYSKRKANTIYGKTISIAKKEECKEGQTKGMREEHNEA